MTSHKNTKSVWQQIKNAQNMTQNSFKTLSDKLNIDGKIITKSHEIAWKLNEFFATVSQRLNSNNNPLPRDDYLRLENYINCKVPEEMIPLITTSQVSQFIHKLDPGKATGFDGIGPRILKLVCDIISPSIADLINKSIQAGHFQYQLKWLRFYLF